MHIEYDDFGSYEETADLVPVAVPDFVPGFESERRRKRDYKIGNRKQ